MKILISGYHNPNFITITEYIEKAFSTIGFKVSAFDDRKHILPKRVRLISMFFQRMSLYIINKNLINITKRELPNMVLITGGNRILPGTIAYINGLGTKTILWTTDAPIHFKPIINAAKTYDHIFCQGSEAVEILERIGCLNVNWLPMGCDTDYHYPVKKDSTADREYDLVFVGSYYPSRYEVLEKIAALKKIKLGIWGPGWKEKVEGTILSKYFFGAHTSVEEWRLIYSKSKMVICLHYKDPMNRFNVYQASPKVFEALACGCFLICDMQRDVFELFENKKHLVGFRDIDSLVSILEFYGRNEKQREVIAQAGYREVVCRHTYKNRVQSLLETIRDR